MTPQEAINTLNSIKQYYNDKNEDSYVGFDNEDNEALGMAIKALEQQPRTNFAETSQDCISRERLLARIDEERKHLLDLKMDGAEHIIVHHARRIIEDMPSARPQSKRGKWMPHMVNNKDESIDHDVCSECHTCFYGERTGDWKYCPNCGSDNRDLESLGKSFADGYEDGLEEK